MSKRTFLLIAASLFASAQERQPGQGVNFYSPEKEAALGRMIADDFRRTHVMTDSPAVMEYVRKLATELAGHVPGGLPSLNIELTIDTDAAIARLHEPVTYPGGYVFVRTSLFLTAPNEAEFAGMLAHAIAHVAERHGMRQATRGQVANLASIPLIFADYHNSVMVPVGMLKSTRLYELEADKLAVNLSAAAGYDPSALLDYVERVQVDNPERQKFSPLPPVEERLAALKASLAVLPQRTYRQTSAAFDEVREEVRLLMQRHALTAAKAPTLRRAGDDERPILQRRP